MVKLKGERHPKKPFQHFSVPQDPILTKNHKFPIFCSKCLHVNFVNFKFLSKPKNWPTSSSGSLIWAKNQLCKQHCCQFSKPLNLALIVLQAPISGCTPLPKWKLRTPPPNRSCVQFELEESWMNLHRCYYFHMHNCDTIKQNESEV